MRIDLLLTAAYETFEKKVANDDPDQASTRKALWRQLFSLATPEDKFKQISYPTFTRTMNGHPHSERTALVLKTLIERLLALWEMTVEDILEYRFDEEDLYKGLQELPEGLEGGWLTIQYRSSRKDGSSLTPPLELRVGALVYLDREDDTIEFREVGPTTEWWGEAYKRDSHIYYKSYQTDSRFEKLNFVMKELTLSREESFHHGMRFGTSFDVFDTPLIYASRLLMWKVAAWADYSEWTSQMEQELKKYCCFLALDEEISQERFGDISEDVKKSVGLFLQRGKAPGNSDGPIFVRV